MAKPVVAWCISEWGKTSQTSTIHNMKRNGFLKKPNLSSICFNPNFLLLCWLLSLTTGLEGPSVQNQRRKQEGWRSPVESRTAGRRTQGPGAQCPCSQPEPASALGASRRASSGDWTTCKPPSVFLRPLTHPLLGSFQLQPDPKEVQLLSSPAFQMALVVKKPPASAGGMRPVSDPWVRKTHWRRKWQPLQYSYLEKPMDRNPGAWRATVSPWGCRVRHN